MCQLPGFVLISFVISKTRSRVFLIRAVFLMASEQARFSEWSYQWVNKALGSSLSSWVATPLLHPLIATAHCPQSELMLMLSPNNTSWITWRRVLTSIDSTIWRPMKFSWVVNSASTHRRQITTCSLFDTSVVSSTMMMQNRQHRECHFVEFHHLQDLILYVYWCVLVTFSNSSMWQVLIISSSQFQ